MGLEVWSVFRGVRERAVARWVEEQPKLRTGVTNTLGSVTLSLNISDLIGNKAGEEEEKCQKRMHFQSGICQN